MGQQRHPGQTFKLSIDAPYPIKSGAIDIHPRAGMVPARLITYNCIEKTIGDIRKYVEPTQDVVAKEQGVTGKQVTGLIGTALNNVEA
jgi:hypothetical protein